MSAAQPRVVADRYRLVEPLGQGGMGRVWMARDELLHRDVAIKELIPPPGLTDDERQEMRERAMREARAIARLSHPNVVRIFDILRTEGEPWIVMEYVRSRSLQEVLAQDGPLPPRRVAEIGLGMIAALRAAHRAGVVHRDVKPGNVLLGDDGRVVLTDFGLATVPGDPVVTRTGLVLGSPAYISPERAHDGTAGPAADMWSLGATLYAAVEGQSPYARPSAIATLAALATEAPAPPRRAGPLKPVLNGLLRKNPAERIVAREAERLLMRAAGRRTRSGVPLLPGTRRPFTEGYLPTAVPQTPVISAVAPVPPQRRAVTAPGAGGEDEQGAPRKPPASGSPKGAESKAARSKAVDPKGAQSKAAQSEAAQPTSNEPPAKALPAAAREEPGSGASEAGTPGQATASARGTSESEAQGAQPQAASTADRPGGATSRPATAEGSPIDKPVDEAVRGGAPADAAATVEPAAPAGVATPEPAAGGGTVAEDTGKDTSAPTTGSTDKAGTAASTVTPARSDASADDGAGDPATLAAATSDTPGPPVAEQATVVQPAVERTPSGAEAATLVDPSLAKRVAAVRAEPATAIQPAVPGTPAVPDNLAGPSRSGRPSREGPAAPRRLAMGAAPVVVVTPPPSRRELATEAWRRRLDWLRTVPPRARVIAAAVLAVLMLAGLAVLVLSNEENGSGGDSRPSVTGPQGAPSGAAPSANPATAQGTTPAAPTATALGPTPTTGGTLTLPAGWHMYHHKTGFSVAVPRSWYVQNDGTMVYFREQTGERRVLGIDRTDHPKSDPVKDWRRQESQRAHLKPNYQRVRIASVDYFLAAADWEYTYDGAARLHAINRGFVTGPAQAHAILWITPERTWDDNLDEFELITKSFVPIP